MQRTHDKIKMHRKHTKHSKKSFFFFGKTPLGTQKADTKKSKEKKKEKKNIFFLYAAAAKTKWKGEKK